MGRIRFYYNTALSKSERVIYYESQIEWKKLLKVYAVSTNYLWDEAHTTADVLLDSLGEATLTNVTTKTVTSLGLIVDANNISYDFTKADFGKVINGFVICNATKPVAIIDKYEEFRKNIKLIFLITKLNNCNCKFTLKGNLCQKKYLQNLKIKSFTEPKRLPNT